MKISNFITCLYGKFLKKIYFIQNLSEIIYFENSPALPLEIEWWLPKTVMMISN